MSKKQRGLIVLWAVIGILVFVGTTIPLKINSDRSEATQYRTPLDVLTDTSTISEIKEAISYVAKKYGIDESSLAQTIKCESQFNHNQYGDSGLAFGISQYHKETFDTFCKGDYYDIRAQLKCMAEMISAGLGKHWSCWKFYFSS